MLIIILVLSIIIVFIILKYILNRYVSKTSSRGWDNTLSDSTINETFKKSFGINAFAYVITKILKPLNINYVKFMSNLFYLATEGNEYNLYSKEDLKHFSLYTPSILHYAKRTHRPRMPIWFIASFPDIIDWINSRDIEQNKIVYDGMDEEKLLSAMEADDDNMQKTDALKIIVDNYLKKVKARLETQ